MAGIAIPDDRTIKQCPRGYCYNKECRNKPEDDRFEFNIEHSRFACPKCGADRPPVAGLLTICHFLVPDPKGPIPGDGGRFRFACDPTRSHLATETNNEAATGAFVAVNCPGCMKEAIEKKLIPLSASAVY